MANTVRENRHQVAQDNPFVKAEHAVSAQIEGSLDRYRDVRDRADEMAFKSIYTAPLVEALAGLRAPYTNARKPRARDEHLEKVLEAKVEALKRREERGGFAEAVVRIALAGAAAEEMVDARGFRLGQQLRDEHPDLRRLSHQQLKEMVKEEALMLRFDRERALATLAKMLPTEAERRQAVEYVHKTASARGEITPERAELIAQIERILGLEPSAASNRKPGAGKAAPHAVAV
jgi:tellurite resistance protein